MSRTRSHCIVKKLLPGVNPDEIDEELLKICQDIKIEQQEIAQVRKSKKITEEDILRINKPRFSNKAKVYLSNSNKVKIG